MPTDLMSLLRGARDRLARLPWPLILTIALAFVAVALLADEALARSGGSSGGSRFRSSSGGGGFSGGGHSSYSGGRSYGGGFFFFGGGGLSGSTIFATLVILVVVMAISSAIKNAKKKAAESSRIYRLRFAMEMPGDKPWEALEQVIRNARRGHGDGLAQQCREVALFLRRHRDKVTHACIAGDGARLGIDAAEQKFLSMTSEARSVFNREVLRIEDGGQVREAKREAEGGDGLHDEDGDFGINEFFAVTLVLALRGARSELPTPLSTQADADTMLARLAGVTEDEMVACEIIWEPAAESDILTADDMLVTYPELGRLL
jgi:uncharacterized membrane protein